MRHLAAVVAVVIVVALAGCATRATKAFTVEVSRYSVEYTPGQIHDYLRARGFQRVQFQAWDSGVMVYEMRNSDINEQHFRMTSHPEIEVIVRLEMRRHTWEKSDPRVIVWFREEGRNTLSPFAADEYRRLLDEVIERVGSDRVEVWKGL